MTKVEMLEFISKIEGEDQRISFVYIDPDGEGDAEESDVLKVADSGYVPAIGHVLYLKKA